MVRTLFLLFALLLANPALAATLQGRVMNGTTGEVGQADLVALFDVTQPAGEPVASASDVSGAFTLEGIPEAAAAHFRLEVHANGAVFTQPIGGFDQPVDAFYYEATDEAAGVVLLRHHVIFTRDPDHLQVTEFFEFENRTDPPRLILGSAHPMRLHLDHDVHGEPGASIWGNGVPVDVPMVPTDEARVLGVEHDLQPGSTRLIVRYLVHEENRSYTWATESLFPTEERRVLVNPEDMQVDAEGMIPTDAAMEGYATYAGLAAQPGDAWTVTVSGGTTVAADTDDHDHESEATQAGAFTDIVARPNRLTDSRAQILLGLGGLLLFATLAVLGSSRRPAPQSPAGQDEARLAVSKVADQYVSGKISREDYEREAARLLKKSGATPKNR